MIYITQLIFVKEGKETIFQEFESFAIPLMKKYGGEMLHRFRPRKEDYIDPMNEMPYEVHILSFDSDKDLSNFMKDEERLQYLHLKEASIEATLLIKGKKL